jgi:ABC-2 type transport system permease protein
MTLLIPIFLVGIIAFQTFLFSYESDKDTKLVLVAKNAEVIRKVEQTFKKLAFIKDGYYSIQFDSLDHREINDYWNARKAEMLAGKLNGVVYIPDSALITKQLFFYSTNPKNYTVLNKIKGPLNEALVDYYFRDKKLAKEEIQYARSDVDFDGYLVTEKEHAEAESYGNTILGMMFTFLLYMSLLIIGATLMRAVVEEKSNKIVEVLLSSVNSSELMFGKVLGAAITGVMQMFIWLLPIIMLIATSWFTLPDKLTIRIDGVIILYFLVNYFIGLVTFLGLFAAVGAMFDSDQDAQSGVWPITMLIMIPFFIAISMQQNPESPIAKVASFLPFASLIVMPARMTMTIVPAWQFILSFLISLATMLCVFPLAGKIYRVGILWTGKKPSFAEVVRWLKYKY